MGSRAHRYGWALGILAGVDAAFLFVWEFLLLVLRKSVPGNPFVDAWLIVLPVSVVLLVYAILAADRVPLRASIAAGLACALAIGPVAWALLCNRAAFRGLLDPTDAWWVFLVFGVPPLIVVVLGILKWRAIGKHGTQNPETDCLENPALSRGKTDSQEGASDQPGAPSSR